MAVGTANTPGSNLKPQGQPSDTPATPYIPIGAPNVVTFNTVKVTPPSPLYIQRDDVIGIEYASLSTNDTLNVAGRFLRASDGVIVPFLQPLKKITAANTAQLDQISLGEGFLLSVFVVNTGQASRGATFARVFIQRGNTALSPLSGMVQMLVADYVQTNAPIGWPGGRVLSPLEGPGTIQSLVPGNPSAGADLSFSPPAGSRVRIMWMAAQLVTSGSAGNRNVEFAFGASNRFKVGAQASIALSTTANFSLATGVGNYTDITGTIVIQIPGNITLRGGTDSVFTVTAGLLAGDQWQSFLIGVEQWEDV